MTIITWITPSQIISHQEYDVGELFSGGGAGNAHNK
jgi:hypothetical protein